MCHQALQRGQDQGEAKEGFVSWRDLYEEARAQAIYRLKDGLMSPAVAA
jgi:hypothetical protein